ADGPHPLVHEAGERPGLLPGHEDDALPARVGHLLRQELDRLLPSGLLQPAARPPHLRAREPVGVVQPLETGLAAGAEPPVVDGRVGVAFELDDAALADAGAETAARSAFAAGRGVPGGDAGDLIVGRDEVGDQLLRRLGTDATAGEGGGAAPCHTEDLEEAPAVHPVGHSVSAAILRNGTPYSRASPCAPRGTECTSPF